MNYMKYQRETASNTVDRGSPHLLLRVLKSSPHEGHIQYVDIRYTTQLGCCRWCYVAPIAEFINTLIQFNFDTIIDGFIENFYFATFFSSKIHKYNINI